jgi:hypothetical protein
MGWQRVPELKESGEASDVEEISVA